MISSEIAHGLALIKPDWRWHGGLKSRGQNGPEEVVAGYKKGRHAYLVRPAVVH